VPRALRYRELRPDAPQVRTNWELSLKIAEGRQRAAAVFNPRITLAMWTTVATDFIRKYEHPLVSTTAENVSY